MKDFKTFADLNIGDTIYYYDHCTIKTKKVTSKPEIVSHKEPCSWISSGYREWSTMNFTTTPGKPINIDSWYGNNFNVEWRNINSSPHFSNKEAAMNFLDKMRDKRERRIYKAQRIIDKETRILKKYKFEYD